MKEKVSWEDMESYIDSLIERLERDVVLERCPGIFTIPRGGFFLATLLSYRTGLPLLTNPTSNCIIIDDICDTGITLKKYSDERKKKNYYITTMFVHEDQLHETAEYNCSIDYFYKIKTDKWIEYPWEKGEKDV